MALCILLAALLPNILCVCALRFSACAFDAFHHFHSEGRPTVVRRPDGSVFHQALFVCVGSRETERSMYYGIPEAPFAKNRNNKRTVNMKFFGLLSPLLLSIAGAAANVRYCLCAADGKGEDQATRRVCNRHIEGVLKMNDGGSVHLGKTSDGLNHDQCVGDTEDAFTWEDFESQCQEIGKVASLNCWRDDD